MPDRNRPRWSTRLLVILSVLTLAAALPATVAAAPPSNDDFASAEIIPPGSLPFTDTTDPSDATMEGGEPEGECDDDVAGTVWYRFKPSTTGAYQVDTIGSNFDTNIDVFSGTTLVSLLTVDCNTVIDTYHPDLYTSRLTFKGKAGQRVYIRVAAQDDVGNSLVVHLRKVTAPANDDYKNATAINALPFATNADVTNATSQRSEPRQSGCASVQRATRWYKFTPNVDMTIWANTFVPVDHDSVLAVYTGGRIGNAAEVICNDDQWISGSVVYASGVTFKAEAGITYRFQVGGYDAESGEFGETPFHVRRVTPEANDDFANAINVNTLPYEDDKNLRRATREPSEVLDCFSDNANTVWYKHTPSSADPLRARTQETEFGAGVAIYEQTGSGFGGLVLVGCSAGGDFDWTPTPSATYMFQVSANNAVALPMQFQLTLDPDP